MVDPFHSNVSHVAPSFMSPFFNSSSRRCAAAARSSAQRRRSVGPKVAHSCSNGPRELNRRTPEDLKERCPRTGSER